MAGERDRMVAQKRQALKDVEKAIVADGASSQAKAPPVAPPIMPRKVAKSTATSSASTSAPPKKIEDEPPVIENANGLMSFFGARAI